jgi:hypothetical protein
MTVTDKFNNKNCLRSKIENLMVKYLLTPHPQHLTPQSQCILLLLVAFNKMKLRQLKS